MNVEILENPTQEQNKKPPKKKRRLFRKKTKEEKLEIACRKALRNATQANSFWLLLIVICILGIAALVILHPTITSSTSFENVAPFFLTFIFIILCLSRLIGNSGTGKRLKGRKKYYKQMPGEVNHLIRELYLIYCKRRCVHFWLTLTFSCLFLLSIMYIAAAAGIDCAVQKGAKPKTIKLADNWTTPASWDWSHKVLATGVIGIILTWSQYIMFRDVNERRINAIETKYGREKIICESLYCFKMNKVNFKYKTITFVIVCLTGCFFYLFFKRLICTIFEKSCII